MSSLYRRNGIYWLSFRLHGKSYCISLRTRDRSTAIYKKAEKDKELIEGRAQLPRHDISCLSTLDEYSKYNEHRRVKRFNVDSASRIRRFLEWGNLRTINQITEGRLQDYLNHRMSHDKIGLYAANNTIICIKAWLNWCVRSRKIFENPVQGIKKFKVPEVNRHFLSKEEITRLLTAAKGETLYSLLATAVYTGLRKDELINLQWEDIDFARGIVTVRNKDGFITKSKKNRDIPLHPVLRTILLPLRKAAGRCFDATNQRRVFRRIAKRTKIPTLKLHELRHTFASQALMAGVPLVTVSKWLGHASVVTTQIYSHLCRDHEEEQINKLAF